MRSDRIASRPRVVPKPSPSMFKRRVSTREWESKAISPKTSRPETFPSVADGNKNGGEPRYVSSF